mmetsp:Transcript_21467/g.51878  ORF Transcript_21467/g.51878 Transcript_21467/m.51878 type:complete len:245 (+) Transcript_21467:871-1605(+)
MLLLSLLDDVVFALGLEREHLFSLLGLDQCDLPECSASKDFEGVELVQPELVRGRGFLDAAFGFGFDDGSRDCFAVECVLEAAHDGLEVLSREIVDHDARGCPVRARGRRALKQGGGAERLLFLDLSAALGGLVVSFHLPALYDVKCISHLSLPEYDIALLERVHLGGNGKILDLGSVEYVREVSFRDDARLDEGLLLDVLLVPQLADDGTVRLPLNRPQPAVGRGRDGRCTGRAEDERQLAER